MNLRLLLLEVIRFLKGRVDIKHGVWMRFEYAPWWRAMRQAGEPDRQVYAHEFHPDHIAIKYEGNADRPGNEVTFVHRAMDVRRLGPDDPLVAHNPGFYEHGAFVVYNRVDGPDQERRNAKAKNLYVVDVQKKVGETYDENGQLKERRVVHAADHFSFVLGAEGGNRALKFHRTEYVPTTATTGWRAQINNFLPPDFDVDDSRAFMRERLHPGMLKHAKVVFDLFSIARHPGVTGGTRQRRRARPRPAVGERFGDLFRTLPLRKVLVFAMPHGAAHDVTIFVEHRLRASGLAPSFVVPGVQSAGDVAVIRQVVADAMHGLTWDDFRTDPQ